MVGVVSLSLNVVIYVSLYITIEMASDKCGQLHYVKDCMCALPAIHRRFILLIGLNEGMRYDVTKVLPIVGPNVISYGPTNGFQIR